MAHHMAGLDFSVNLLFLAASVLSVSLTFHVTPFNFFLVSILGMILFIIPSRILFSSGIIAGLGITVRSYLINLRFHVIVQPHKMPFHLCIYPQVCLLPQ